MRRLERVSSLLKNFEGKFLRAWNTFRSLKKMWIPAVASSLPVMFDASSRWISAFLAPFVACVISTSLGAQFVLCGRLGGPLRALGSAADEQTFLGVGRLAVPGCDGVMVIVGAHRRIPSHGGDDPSHLRFVRIGVVAV